MDEGRKRVLAIVAGILVARHLKTTEDLFDSKSSPRTESMVAAAVQWELVIEHFLDQPGRAHQRVTYPPLGPAISFSTCNAMANATYSESLSKKLP